MAEHFLTIFRSTPLDASLRNNLTEALRGDHILVPILYQISLFLNHSLSNLDLVLVFLPIHQ